MIELGSYVVDTISGFKGIVTYITKPAGGPITITIEGKLGNEYATQILPEGILIPPRWDIRKRFNP